MKIIDRIHKIFCNIVSVFFTSRTVRHVLSLNRSEKKEFLKRIIDENKKQNFHDNNHYVQSTKSTFRLVQSYNQLPCTLETRKKRADLFEKNGFRDKSILLMGDDDHVSVELAARNFKYVTVLDCDLQLLQELKVLTQDAKYQITFFHVDLYEGLPKFLQNIFDVVCFDPPQNYEDLNVFLKCALKATKIEFSNFYMMVNCNSLGIKNIEKIFEVLKKSGFVNSKRIEFFNCYPLNKGQSLLLTAMSYFTHSFKERKEGVHCRYYYTDCLEFKAESIQKKNEDLFEEKQIISPVVSHHISLPELPIAIYNQYGLQNRKNP
ncbi:bis-aminopropyl spermidine synthase family protein [Fluviispira multicolorata]|uniref:Putative methyltransferase n=1 Tax=Fluviispira multicolorata TaxID=2654512 RepID=A0A833N4Z6_9BACT|nr:bis-aminopropyl spermidine synthase family protein [Fluviispira multicolorata]KAB8029228.1 putative methyltransferase [Fluviispira multicolorata]